MVPKYQTVADSLRQEIESGQYSERQLLPTEQVLCQRFQISRQTVRRALSLLEDEGLITRRQGSGSRLREHKEPEAILNCAIAVVTTYIGDYIFPDILRGMERVLSANSSAPLLFATQNQLSVERKILQTLLTMKELDGVLVEGTKTALPNPNLDLYQKLIDRGIHLVFIHGIYPELTHIPSVLADDYGGGRMLTEHLHRQGHQNIAGIFKVDDMQGMRRYAGYAGAMRDLGLPFEDEHVRWYNTERRKDFQSDSFMDSLLEGIQGCSAVVCYNDEVAIRVVSRLQKRGVRVPEEVAVVSFDNSYLCQLGPVPVTSLSHRSHMGRVAAEQIIELTRGGTASSKFLKWELVVRSSG